MDKVNIYHDGERVVVVGYIARIKSDDEKSDHLVVIKKMHLKDCDCDDGGAGDLTEVLTSEMTFIEDKYDF